MRRLTVISNPGSGGRRDRTRSLSTMLELLRQRGIGADVHETAGPGDATRLSREALEAGAQTIVVHGGDGTVNEAMQPLVGGPVPAWTARSWISASSTGAGAFASSAISGPASLERISVCRA